MKTGSYCGIVVTSHSDVSVLLLSF